MDDSYISLEDLADMTVGGGSSSLPYCGSTLEEERPGSSLSTASRSSRIPVLTRSHSLRGKNSPSSSSSHHHHHHHANTTSSHGKGSGGGGGGGNKASSKSSGKGLLVRSASFVTSRGMKGFFSSSSSPSSPPTTRSSIRAPLTPDTPRRYPAPHPAPQSAPHARHSTPSSSSSSSSTADRKAHSYAGIGSSWHHHQHHHHHHHSSSSSSNNTSRRPNYLPVISGSSSQFTSLPVTPASHPDTPSRSPDSNEIDDCDSIKSFGSVSSAVSCDAALSSQHHSRCMGKGSSCGGGGSSSGRGTRSLKYVLHCRHNHELDPEQYLTPTQRAARKIRELKSQLSEARREVAQRDSEISRLTRELVELRLLKARTPHWEDDEEGEEGGGEKDERRDKVDNKGKGVADSPPPTHAHAASKPSSTPSEGSEPELRRLMENMSTGAQDTAAPPHPCPASSPAGVSVAETTVDSVDLTRSSLADSGHYDDLTSPCLSARDPLEPSRGSARSHLTEEEEEEEEKLREVEEVDEDSDGRLLEVVVGGGTTATAATTTTATVDPWVALEEAECRVREEYMRREEVLKRNHLEEYNELKEKHNDRVEVLLSKLSDANLKYFELRPLYDQSQDRVREMEREMLRLKEELTEAELRHQKMYLQMFLKGQQAARIQAEDDLDGGEEGLMSSVAANGPVVELMRQLSRTEEELEKVKALYHREITCRNNNNNNNNNNNSSASNGCKRNGELDPEVTLQFLKSAIYYFFTDRDNAKGHLRAIESILGYSDSERHNIGKVIK